MKPLNVEYQHLWNSPANKDNKFYYPNLVRIRTITDGSCFFHAVSKAFFEPYITGTLNGLSLDRKEFVKKLRTDLSKKLGQKINPENPNSPRYYDILSRGELEEMSKDVPAFRLENLQNLLDSNRPVDNVFNEFVSNQLDKDIYILDGNKKDVYITGRDEDILYKDRPSIVILYIPGHYELIGVKDDNDNDDGVITTLFSPDHSLIKAIKNRIIKLIK